MDAVAYCRVSTSRQDFELQRVAISRAAKSRGDRVTQWYVDTKSGATGERDGLVSLLGGARDGSVRRVYVYRIDRLSRGGIRATLDVVERLRSCGCSIVTTNDGFAIDGPGADVVIAVIAWAAQVEREALCERVASKRRAVEARGGHWGRPVAIDKFTLRRAQQLRGEDMSIRQICVRLHCKRATLTRALAQKGAYSKPRVVGKK